MLDKMIVKDAGTDTVKDAEVKTEVVAAYHELLHKLKQNKKDSHQMSANGEEIDAHDVAAREEFDAVDAVIVQAMQKEKPGDYTRNIENLKFTLNDALDDVKEKFLFEQRKLISLIEAIENKSKKVAEIHDIEVNIDTLSALIAAHKEKSELFEEEIHERRQQFEHEMAQKRRELQSEEQKYVYQRDLAREKDRNRYEISKRDLEQELIAIRQKANKELDEREMRIATNELLNEKIAQFPEELRVAVQKAKDSNTKQLTIKFEYEHQLAQKEIQLHEQKIATLEAKIIMLESNITHFESLKNSFNHLLFNRAES